MTIEYSISGYPSCISTFSLRSYWMEIPALHKLRSHHQELNTLCVLTTAATRAHIWSVKYNYVRVTAKIRKRYNQVPHLTQDTTWESDKNTIKYSKKWAKLTYPRRKPPEVVTLSEKRQNCQRFHNPKSSSFWENFDEKCSYVLYKSDRRKNWKFEKRRHNED